MSEGYETALPASSRFVLTKPTLPMIDEISDEKALVSVPTFDRPYVIMSATRQAFARSWLGTSERVNSSRIAFNPASRL
ncbi:hypothetical protein [Sulfitobacter sp.]|uniref:hypothetical protein n=1 Tax=Sulfitobacter sp. TaxID=1903071 RepID=UPI003001D74E